MLSVWRITLFKLAKSGRIPSFASVHACALTLAVLHSGSGIRGRTPARENASGRKLGPLERIPRQRSRCNERIRYGKAAFAK